MDRITQAWPGRWCVQLVEREHPLGFANVRYHLYRPEMRTNELRDLLEACGLQFDAALLSEVECTFDNLQLGALRKLVGRLGSRYRMVSRESRRPSGLLGPSAWTFENGSLWLQLDKLQGYDLPFVVWGIAKLAPQGESRSRSQRQ